MGADGKSESGWVPLDAKEGTQTTTGVGWRGHAGRRALRRQDSNLTTRCPIAGMVSKLNVRDTSPPRNDSPTTPHLHFEFPTPRQ